MKTIFALALISVLVISGCCGQAVSPAPSGTGEDGGQQLPQENLTPAGGDETPPEDEPAQPTGDGTIIEVPDQSGTGDVAQSQEECATMSATCGQCLSKSGCGFCKSTNSCLLGDADGPGVSSCPEADWTVTEEGCNVVPNEDMCGSITNCATCLSGSGCKWCIQGSICRGASNTDSCVGGWLDKSYQCKLTGG
ncbi:MAG: hypothetical protein V1827_05860 [Candidatus Micrarchaeota archaeon]